VENKPEFCIRKKGLQDGWMDVQMAVVSDMSDSNGIF
jgi:hypothetical protein